MKKIFSARIKGTLIGILAGAIVSLVTLTANWSHNETFDLPFAKGVATRYSNYYSISASCDVAAYQASGNSSMKYTFYYKKRTASKWTTIRSAVSFAKNGESNIRVLGNYPGAVFQDVQIKVYKTQGTGTYSKICGYIGY